jgi:FlaA1/EpsC-like NDP-sugar epimerase
MNTFKKRGLFLNFWNKRTLIFPIDLTLMALSYFLAHMIRYETFEFLNNPKRFFTLMALVVTTKGIIFFFSGIYRALWAYASLHDLIEIIKFTIISSLVSVTVILFYNRFEQHSRMVPILDALLLLGFLCIRSLSWRMIREFFLNPIKNPSKHGKPTLLIGADQTGVFLINDLKHHNDLGLKPIGFLDDDIGKQGSYLQKLPILGTIQELERCIDENNIKEVIIVKQNLPAKNISTIQTICKSHNVNLRILPSVTEFISGLKTTDHATLLREIQVEDLLGRDTVNLEVESIRSYLTNHTILITGAAGSIGSEITRQIAQFLPSKMILLDSAETPLYEIDYEIQKKFPDLPIVSIVADVKSLSRLQFIFETHKPSVVFHCAAYKHVPLMELNPSEAVLNNVMGTKNVADLSKLHSVERFVLISTDKAVNPVNIMGASKRAAELYIQSIAPNANTNFITVRFGNVLGSNGSVIPRFKSQIEKGGPITVTHPDVIRYFMTIPEASQLVLQAGSMGAKGDIFILDMGEPVKILELAEEMIRLSGFVPYEDIDIEFTGLRPGEKLYEELLLDIEGLKKTHHPKIQIVGGIELNNSLLFLNKLNKLFELAKSNKNIEIYAMFKEIIPEYLNHKEYLNKDLDQKRLVTEDGR